MEAKYQEVITLTDQFAAQHLNEEYAELIRLATAALCRKRPSPLTKGKANSWACGITHAIGLVISFTIKASRLTSQHPTYTERLVWVTALARGNPNRFVTP